MTETKTEKKKDEKKADVREVEAQPDIVLNATSADTTVGVVHRRNVDVNVPEYDDMSTLETIESDPVDYFQVAGSPVGAVFSFNGAAYALSASQVASFKGALDSVVVGLSL